MVRQWKGDGSGKICRGYQVASEQVAPNKSGIESAPYLNPAGTQTAPSDSGIANIVYEDTNANPNKFYLLLAQVDTGAHSLTGPAAARGLRVTEGSLIDISAPLGLSPGAVTVTCAATAWATAHVGGPIHYIYSIVKATGAPYATEETGNLFVFDLPTISGYAGHDDAVAGWPAGLTYAQTIDASITGWSSHSGIPGNWARVGTVTVPTKVVAGQAFEVDWEIRDARTSALIDISPSTPDPISLRGSPQTTGVNSDYDSSNSTKTQVSAGNWKVTAAKIFHAGIKRIGVNTTTGGPYFPVLDQPTWGPAINVIPAAPAGMRFGFPAGNPVPPNGGRLRLKPVSLQDDSYNRLDVTGQDKFGNYVTEVAINTWASIRLTDQYSNDCGEECPPLDVHISLVDTNPATTAVPGFLDPDHSVMRPYNLRLLDSSLNLISWGTEQDYQPGIVNLGPIDDLFVLLSGKAVFTTVADWPNDGVLTLTFPPGRDSFGAPITFVGVTVSSIDVTGGFSAVVDATARKITITRDGTGLTTPAGTFITILIAGIPPYVTDDFQTVVAVNGLAVFDNIRVFGLSRNFKLRFNVAGLPGNYDFFVTQTGTILRIDCPTTCRVDEPITVTATHVTIDDEAVTGAFGPNFFDTIFINDGPLPGGFTASGSSAVPPISSASVSFTGSFGLPGTFNLFLQSSNVHYGDIGWYSPNIVVTL